MGTAFRCSQQVGQQLQVVGSLTGIAPNENLHSVRFVGERAFFVTFRTVDPLFAVDLSNPENPELLGELHVPGYSDYLHMIDENHVLAIGRGADERTGFFEELQVSIFDVSNMTDPKLIHRYSFGGGRSTVTAATGDRWLLGDGDHHAVSLFGDDQIFALPIVSVANSGWWGGPNATPLFAEGEGGLQVFRIDIDTGFSPLALIEHDTPVERSVRIGDRLYAISSGQISVHDMADPEIERGRLSLGVSNSAPTVTLMRFQPAFEVLMETSLATAYVEVAAELAVEAVVEEATTNDTVVEETAAPAVVSWPQVAESRQASRRAVASASLRTSDRFDSGLLRLLASERANREELTSSNDREASSDLSGSDDAFDEGDELGMSDLLLQSVTDN